MERKLKRMQRVRDAYMEPWTEFETWESLLVAYDLAYKLAMLTRALSWNHRTGSLSNKYKELYAELVPGWLQDFLIAEKAA